MTRTAEPGPLVLVEDDRVFASVLARALTLRGFTVHCVVDLDDAVERARHLRPRYAVVDLKLGEDSGLDVISALHTTVPGIRMLLLTGYASIATAVEAMRRGAHDYLAKPVDVDTIVHALLGDASQPTVPGAPLSLPRLEWEHIQRTLHECAGNISEAARRLGIHRRTLQRRLDKHPVHERDTRW